MLIHKILHPHSSRTTCGVQTLYSLNGQRERREIGTLEERGSMRNSRGPAHIIRVFGATLLIESVHGGGDDGLWLLSGAGEYSPGAPF